MTQIARLLTPLSSPYPKSIPISRSASVCLPLFLPGGRRRWLGLGRVDDDGGWAWEKRTWWPTRVVIRGVGPIFWDVGVNSNGGDMIQTLQPLYHCSVGYQPSTTWLTSPPRLSLQTNHRIKARKDKHAIWNCKYGWSKNKYGVQVLITKGLIDTVATNNSEGPASQQKNSTL
jgi:hypothetical protein